MPAPNVIVLCTDDIGFNEIGVYRERGFPDRDAYRGARVHTPNLDRLAREGVLLTRFYATSPICTPSRYSILTGRYASRSPSLLQKVPPPAQVCIGWNANISREEGNLGTLFKQRGYATGYVGKWHNGNPRVNSPELRSGGDPRDPAFSRRTAELYDAALAHLREGFGYDYADRVWFGNREASPEPLQVHNLEWMAEGALEFIDANQDRPFFLYVASSTPHGDYDPLAFDPLRTPRGLLEKRPVTPMPPREEIPARLKKQGHDPKTAMATWMDDCFGAILDRLDELGLSENTIVLYTNDHLARGKYMCYEGARVPCLVRWPKGIPGGRELHRLCANIDLAATLAELSGAPLDASYPTDGLSFAPLLSQPEKEHRWREQLLLEVSNIRAIVTERWKYIACRAPGEVLAAIAADKKEAETTGRKRWVSWDGKRNPHAGYENEGIRYFQCGEFAHYFDPDQLYDLEADVFETNNLAGRSEHAEVLKQLQAALGEELQKLPHGFGEFKATR